MINEINRYWHDHLKFVQLFSFLAKNLIMKYWINFILLVPYLRNILHLIAQPFTFVKIWKLVKPKQWTKAWNRKARKSNSISDIDLFKVQIKKLKLHVKANEEKQIVLDEWKTRWGNLYFFLNRSISKNQKQVFSTPLSPLNTWPVIFWFWFRPFEDWVFLTFTYSTLIMFNL